MIKQFWQYVTDLFWNKPVKVTFDRAALAALWALLIFLLAVSIPHSIEVVFGFERGPVDAREFKAFLISASVEIITALVLLICLHKSPLSWWGRSGLVIIVSPFLALALHLQWVYYDPTGAWPLIPIELALTMPYGAVVITLTIGVMLGRQPLNFSRSKNKAVKPTPESVKPTNQPQKEPVLPTPAPVAPKPVVTAGAADSGADSVDLTVKIYEEPTPLTTKKAETVRLYQSGVTNKTEIARRLSISEGSVRNYLKELTLGD